MSFLKKLPIRSLLILVLTYTLFGWVSAVSWRDWLEGGILVLVVSLLLIAPLKTIRFCFSSWLASDARAFIAIIALSFLTVVVLAWIQIFAQFFILLSAGMLVRLDLQTAGFGEWQAFGVMVVITLASFIFGVGINYVWLQTIWVNFIS